eukprot:30920-Pelagococcus_subviridis.AAC.2
MAGALARATASAALATRPTVATRQNRARATKAPTRVAASASLRAVGARAVRPASFPSPTRRDPSRRKTYAPASATT